MNQSWIEMFQRSICRNKDRRWSKRNHQHQYRDKSMYQNRVRNIWTWRTWSKSRPPKSRSSLQTQRISKTIIKSNLRVSLRLAWRILRNKWMNESKSVSVLKAKSTCTKVCLNKTKKYQTKTGAENETILRLWRGQSHFYFSQFIRKFMGTLFKRRSRLRETLRRYWSALASLIFLLRGWGWSIHNKSWFFQRFLNPGFNYRLGLGFRRLLFFINRLG